jgi:hypothetical protein
MHPLVRDLYKRFLVAGREYSLGLAYVREKAKAAFMRNAQLTDMIEVKRAVKRGRYMVREIIAVIKLKKYRAMKARYAKNTKE